jgi:hypothetical protein
LILFLPADHSLTPDSMKAFAARVKDKKTTLDKNGRSK